MYKGVGLVRDKNGKPKIDGDPNALNPAILQMMTAEERKELGVWEGPMARDAHGVKRLSKQGASVFEAVDALVAVSEVFDGDKHYRLTQRIDVPVGGTFGRP